MLMKPYIAHYMNKYPQGAVDSDGESYLRAKDASGRLRISLVNANGVVQDNGKLLGAKDKHDLSPIPKDCRHWCDKGHGVEAHREFSERKEIAEKVAEKFDGRVPSVEEMIGRDISDHRFVDEQFKAAKWLEEQKG